MTIGERIKKLREEKNITVDKLAELIGKNRATIYRYESSEIEKLPTSVLEPLCKALGTTPAYLMGWTDSNLSNIKNIEPIPTMVKVPLLGTIACGEPILAEENIEDYINMPEKAKGTFALRCKGDSMINARIFDGDIVFIREQPEVENGEIAAVLIDDEATLKRVYKTENSIELRPENPTFKPLYYQKEEMNKVRILGKAVGFYSNIY
ncbi:transcriptional repressor LexA [uncultured Ruminococcus sp.]|jgi:repressor LexA|uniref:transcriptional repressor LexA n=1 Tax=uncultured Ruminococcus sp. TaxID=165186 RepID=UPI00265CFD85|nr:transcriptional repressor LexA [uncultured Ruminococcus sp.]